MLAISRCWLVAVLLITSLACAAATPQDPPAPPVAASQHLMEPPALLGLYSLRLDNTTGDLVATLAPVRDTAALGDTFALDASRYFTGQFCGSCVQLTGVGLVDLTTLDVSITLTHPFPMPTPPLGPQERIDLFLFDVAGLIVSDAGSQMFPGAQIRLPAPIVLNPDGYSGALDPPLERIFPTPAVDAHPYRIYRPDASNGNFGAGNPNGFADVFAPTGHNVFPQGASATQTYRLRLPNSNAQVTFAQDLLFVVTGQWGAGTNNQPGAGYLQRGNPAYFLPAFNQAAAFRVTTQLTDNQLAGGTAGSSATLNVSLSDWQWGIPVDPGFPDTAHLDQLRAPSDPAQILVEIPGVTAAPLQVDPGTGIGTGVTRQFSIPLTNSASGAEGDYRGLVAVIDGLNGAQGIAQDDPQPIFLGQLATYQQFLVHVGPNQGGGGDFGPAFLISDREVFDNTGHYNTQMPELVTDGSDLYVGYQGIFEEAVVARSTNGGGAFTNVEVYSAAPGAFLDPTLGCDAGGMVVHTLLAAPEDTGLFGSRSTDNGGTWGSLTEVHDDGGNPDDSQAITSGAGTPVAAFGTFLIAGPLIQLAIETARFTGTDWTPGDTISDLKPHASDTLVRVDETPMVHRLANGTVVCIFGSNERSIAMLDDDFAGEPVAVLSLDDGATWQDWSYVHAFNPGVLYDTLSSTAFGDTLFMVEAAEDGTVKLYRSTNEGGTWTLRSTPAALTTIADGLIELVARSETELALIWAPGGMNPKQLVVATSDDAGASWATPIPCDDDGGNSFDPTAVSAVYTTDGKLHVAFIDDRHGTGEPRWWMVSEQ